MILQFEGFLSSLNESLTSPTLVFELFQKFRSEMNSTNGQ
jgi:hypothetical protein